METSEHFSSDINSNYYLSVLYTESINIKLHDELIFGVIFAFYCLFLDIHTLLRVSLYNVLCAKHAMAFGRISHAQPSKMRAKRAFFYLYIASGKPQVRPKKKNNLH